MQVCVGIALEATAIAATAVIPAGKLPAAVHGEVDGRGGLDNVGGGGALSASLTQNVGLVGVHSGHQDGVLVRLRRGQPQSLVLVLESADLVLAQIVEDRPGPGVLRVNDVPCVVVHGVLESAGVGGHIVVHAVNRPLRLAAAGGQLCLEGVVALEHSNLSGVEALLSGKPEIADRVVHPVEAVQHAGVHGVEAITQTLVYATNSVLQLREIHVGTKIGSCQSTTSVVAEAAAPAAVTPAEDHCEQDYGKPSIVSPHAAVIAAVAIAVIAHHVPEGEVISFSHNKKSPFQIFASQGRTLPDVCTLGAVLDHDPQTEKEK